jgi:hypothetical protein
MREKGGAAAAIAAITAKAKLAREAPRFRDMFSPDGSVCATFSRHRPSVRLSVPAASAASASLAVIATGSLSHKIRDATMSPSTWHCSNMNASPWGEVQDCFWRAAIVGDRRAPRPQSRRRQPAAHL